MADALAHGVSNIWPRHGRHPHQTSEGFTVWPLLSRLGVILPLESATRQRRSGDQSSYVESLDDIIDERTPKGSRLIDCPESAQRRIPRTCGGVQDLSMGTPCIASRATTRGLCCHQREPCHRRGLLGSSWTSWILESSGRNKQGSL